ncbi:uncharacterized protein LOC132281813 [Cornus florida]|uniref:uncharacterized protein LOC132281813 n=1 Tax=Cornus florida TaxID=4283 RepID=UPI00289EBD7B|nr:uncharacterized protein LOC132281813 [Cornus florida]
MEEEGVGKERGRDKENPNSNQSQNQVKGEGLGSSKKGKSCKGCLYYSSNLKSNSRNPFCLGIPRSLPQVPRYIVGESEMEASKEGRSLADFKYACVGYSVYSDGKNPSIATPETQAELPVCVGIEVLVDKRAVTADSVPAHVHNREDARGTPRSRTQKPAHSVGDEFLNRFSRNASLVAMGVAKNMRKVGNQIKDTFDDILYPYRRRPK